MAGQAGLSNNIQVTVFFPFVVYLSQKENKKKQQQKKKNKKKTQGTGKYQ